MAHREDALFAALYLFTIHDFVNHTDEHRATAAPRCLGMRRPRWLPCANVATRRAFVHSMRY
jgi:hypothetical protein